MSNAESQVSEFYRNYGWNDRAGITKDALLFEDLRDCAKSYVSKCRQRLLRYIPESGTDILDMASGPIQYPEYLQYSANFKTRHCVDLSSTALESASRLIGDHGKFYQGSFFDLFFADNSFDCSISLHTIYHMDKSMQATAIRKLIRATKPRCNVIVVYANPYSLFSLLILIPKLIRRRAKKLLHEDQTQVSLYFYAYPLSWWKQFSDEADVSLYPWRSMAATLQKTVIPDNNLGKRMLSYIYRLEDKFPRLFLHIAQYPTVVLTKH